MKQKLLKIDLSKYNDYDRLPSEIEMIIKNALIISEGNVKKISKLYNITEDQINKIFIQYYDNIIQIIENKTDSENIDNILDDSISLLQNHVKDIKKKVDIQGNNILTDKITKNINSVIDSQINAIVYSLLPNVNWLNHGEKSRVTIDPNSPVSHINLRITEITVEILT